MRFELQLAVVLRRVLADKTPPTTPFWVRWMRLPGEPSSKDPSTVSGTPEPRLMATGFADLRCLSFLCAGADTSAHARRRRTCRPCR